MLRSLASTRYPRVSPNISNLYTSSSTRSILHARTQHPTITSIHTKQTTPNTTTMADDTSYSTFLSKANESPVSGSRPDQPQTSTSQARSAFDPTTPSSSLPASLRSLPDTPYVSDTDSDWEVVFFNYASDSAPSEAEFKDVLKASRGDGEYEVQELKTEEFDPRGQYKQVVEKVKKAGKGEGEGVRGNGQDTGVQVFRVESGKGGTRCEYFVLTVGERKLVGVVAKAVES